MRGVHPHIFLGKALYGSDCGCMQTSLSWGPDPSWLVTQIRRFISGSGMDPQNSGTKIWNPRASRGQKSRCLAPYYLQKTSSRAQKRVVVCASNAAKGATLRISPAGPTSLVQRTELHLASSRGRHNEPQVVVPSRPKPCRK